MNLDLWVDRLKQQCPDLQGRVFVAVELANTEPAALQTPCVFVVPLSEAVDGNASSSGQKVVVQIAVVSVVKNVRDARGGAAFNALDSVRDSIKTALSGWQPETGITSTKFMGGSPNYFDDMIVSWVDRFESFYYLKYGVKK